MGGRTEKRMKRDREGEGRMGERREEIMEEEDGDKGNEEKEWEVERRGVKGGPKGGRSEEIKRGV